MESVNVNEIVFLFQDGRIIKKGQPSKQHYTNQVFIVRGARHKPKSPLTACWEFAKWVLNDSQIMQKNILSFYKMKTVLFSHNFQLWQWSKATHWASPYVLLLGSNLAIWFLETTSNRWNNFNGWIYHTKNNQNENKTTVNLLLLTNVGQSGTELMWTPKSFVHNLLLFKKKILCDRP